MKALYWMIGLVAAAIACAWIAARYGPHRAGGVDRPGGSGLTVEQARDLSSLVTTRVAVADVVQSDLSGYTGGISAVIAVKGDLLIGVDLAQARFASVDRARRTAVLVLPQPAPVELRLDHDRSRVCVLSEHGLWQLAPGGGPTAARVIDRGYRDAQRIIERASEDPTLLPRARGHAEQAIDSFFQATGWSVTVRWEP